MKIDSPAARRFIADEINEVLDRHRLPHDSPIRQDLESRAEFREEDRNPILYMRDESDSLVTPDRRIEQLRGNPDYRSCFPAERPKVPRHDLEKTRDHFEEIRTGVMSVE